MVIASYNLSQTNRVPYVTITEVLNSAIANNVFSCVITRCVVPGFNNTCSAIAAKFLRIF